MHFLVPHTQTKVLARFRNNRNQLRMGKHILIPSNEDAKQFIESAPTVFIAAISAEIACRYTWHFNGDDNAVLVDMDRRELHFIVN